jgi:hypothetical protein
MGQMVAQFNRGRFARDAKFISIQAAAMDGVFFRGFDNTGKPSIKFWRGEAE